MPAIRCGPDADGIYVNLNDSFLAVSFEGQTGAGDEITPAQIAVRQGADGNAALALRDSGRRTA